MSKADPDLTNVLPFRDPDAPDDGPKGAPVTAESLKRLCEQRQVFKIGKPLSRNGYAGLAHDANTIRFRMFLGRLFSDMRRQPVRVMPDALPCPEALAGAERAARVRLHQWLPALEAIAGKNGFSPPFPEQWHQFAPWLADRFRVAMHSTNPGPVLGTAAVGPLTCFLAAVIPLITGETPKPPAIGRYLQRMRHNKGKNVPGENR